MWRRLEGPSYSELVVKRSTFIGLAYPLSSLEEASRFRAMVAREHEAASCVPWACRLAREVGTEEVCSDGGEPPDSAGRPILAAIRRKEVVDVIVLVVRYFGGTKLGLKGLAEAYHLTASRALERAKLAELKRVAEITLLVPYEFVGYAEAKARSLGAKITERSELTEGLKLKLSMLEEQIGAAEEIFNKWLARGDIIDYSLKWN